MNEQTTNTDDDVDLFKIIDFFVAAWKPVVVTAIVGGLAGLSWAFTLPEKFQASANIMGGRVLGSDLEQISVLVEKMQSPTFYSKHTIDACSEFSSNDQAQFVAQMVKPAAPRNSSFFTVSAKMRSGSAAQGCLVSVLEDVRISQKQEFLANKVSHEEELAQVQLDLNLFKNIKAEEIASLNEKLTATKELLVNADNAIQDLQRQRAGLEVTSENYYAATLLLSGILEQEKNKVKLQEQLIDLESRIRLKAAAPQTEKTISELNMKFTNLQQKLAPPITQEAIFSTPVYSPKIKVEPRKASIAVSGAVVGGALGLIWTILQSSARNYRKRRSSRRASEM